MKKLIVVLLLTILSVVGFSQSIFHPMPNDLFKVVDRSLGISEGTTTHSWAWRFDATVAFTELVYDKTNKQFITSMFSAVGPAVGYQHYVATSSTDPTPFNNYGFSAAILFGKNVTEPDLGAIKLAVIANLFQYFRFGASYTPNTSNHFGILVGGGITF